MSSNQRFNRRLLQLTLAVSFLLCQASVGLTEDKIDDTDKDNGPLQDVAEHIGALMKLSWKQGNIKHEIPTDRTAVNAIFTKMRQQAGSGGYGSSSGGDSWSYNFRASKMTAKVGYRSVRNLDTDSFELDLAELVKPNRHLRIESSSNGKLSIMYTGGENAYFFRFNQDLDGKLLIQEIDGDRMVSQRRDSFAELCRTNDEFVQTRLIPLLSKLGIQAPLTPHDSRVAAEVRRILQPVDPQRTKTFADLALGLDSNEFSIREKALIELAEKFDMLAAEIRYAALDKSNSAETRSRLLQLIRKKSKPIDLSIFDIVAKTRLTKEPKYLVWLLSNSKASDRAHIIAKLEDVSKRKFANDVEKWQTWLKSQSKPDKIPSITSSSVNLLAENGLLQKVAVGTSRLVKLELKGDSLRLSRKHWAKSFGGKTIKQLSDEIDKEVKKRGLPTSWWYGVSTRESIGFADVLFLSIQDQLAKNQSYRPRSSYRRRGQHQFEWGGLKASLKTMENPTNAFAVARKPAATAEHYFSFNLEEKTTPFRSLTVNVNKKNRLQVTLNAPNSHSVVRLIELPNGSWVIQDVRDTEIFAAKAESFRKLYDENREYMTSKLFPLMKHVGITFDVSTN